MARQPRQLAGLGASDLQTAAAIKAYVGPAREVIADGQTLRVHDGTTPGGIPLATRKIPTQSRNPTSADIAQGEWTVWTNSATGTTSVWANLAGTLVDMLNKPEF
ncbi:hypothetical protein G3T14_19595 [Methylobacterium sp. BTF04]|uniref:hypothetical protein n=1 Tax=Methylobacterium sp. BTF04 TaxID=2708300 RepID=UPI0013D6E54B|nr:hypothetical protein [Methylobacterium sp. BTF04]NEU14314.1 hypothetical protein [Methylobacterium sp. BTF04]